ncbi:MAG TPA: ankyrin repeat domain-containing protein [Rhodocyclaceae bacterium]|nr:ankyrin repeat domain-containing protein [Rhodocyclaceae bacterium]HMZ83175.1 ankyrin repeat domain-containing protein [Rhodocyclaceae bacterium]HNA02868.1 ankyrin repeat domain-containing protein [Rhodocyclaceae bacterium]HNB77924.1 ankyrin repeat domain-containing protein [Rhodocyclaceae bacterium]HNC60127.1 ankyrin repeat domain-containing protein [Rhodocyclaceae bacterium]
MNRPHPLKLARRLAAALAGLMIAGSVLAQTFGANDQPIHDAARMGSAVEIQAILKATPDARDARTGRGSTPLHLAATNPDAGPLKALLAAGADVNARDGEGATPLHMAAYTQRTENARLLLEAGADTTAKTHSGRDPLSMARKNMANEVAGVISLWILKGCKPGKAC